ncbi:MAG: WD40/YVTN/BNR-like repeat-containing protein, partial [Nitrososphaerota archaeon]
DTDANANADDALQITVSPLPIPPRPPRRSWRLATGAAGLAAVLIISLLAGLIFLSHGRPLAPAIGKATPTVVPGTQHGIYAIGMSSTTDGWAMGDSHMGIMEASQDAVNVLHYTNGRWVPVQAAISGGISAIKMISPTDGWAVGANVYHYDGTSWRMVYAPLIMAGSYYAISIVSAGDIWIAGSGPGGDQAQILHYHSGSWTQQPVPSLEQFTIHDIAMVSADDGWAVGTSIPTTSTTNTDSIATPTGAILRYQHGAWQLVKTMPKYELNSISMGSAADGWIGGDMQTISGGYQQLNGQFGQTVLSVPVTLHYTRGAWVEVPFPEIGGTPAAGDVTRIIMSSTDNGWMLAPLENQILNPDDASYLTPGIFHLERGRWVQIKAPLLHDRRFASVYGIAYVAPDEFWGVGDTGWCSGAHPSTCDSSSVVTVTPLIVHYQNGSWTVVES